jgi:hypothetical protein
VYDERIYDVHNISMYCWWYSWGRHDDARLLAMLWMELGALTGGYHVFIMLFRRPDHVRHSICCAHQGSTLWLLYHRWWPDTVPYVYTGYLPFNQETHEEIDYEA